MVKCTHKALISVPSTVTIITTINSNNELFLTTAIEDVGMRAHTYNPSTGDNEGGL